MTKLAFKDTVCFPFPYSILVTYPFTVLFLKSCISSGVPEAGFN